MSSKNDKLNSNKNVKNVWNHSFLRLLVSTCHLCHISMAFLVVPKQTRKLKLHMYVYIYIYINIYIYLYIYTYIKIILNTKLDGCYDFIKCKFFLLLYISKVNKFKNFSSTKIYWMRQDHLNWENIRLSCDLLNVILISYVRLIKVLDNPIWFIKQKLTWRYGTTKFWWKIHFFKKN